MPPRVIALVGATATGKTALGEALARALGGEVVCADSRQVFGALELGTGKPTPEERAALPHHLFDWLALGERPSAGGWARAAGAACAAIHARGRVPVLVGGSGLWLEAAARGLAQEPPHDAAIRERLVAEARAIGIEALHARLAAVDPATAARLAPRDRQRVTRALEVYEASGRTQSWWHAQPHAAPVPGGWRRFELVVPPEALAERIERRTRAMFEAGLAEETRALLDAGHGASLGALRAVGYDEAIALLEGRMTRAGAEARTALRTRQLARRQRTWFRHRGEAEPLAAEPYDIGRLLRQALTRLA